MRYTGVVDFDFLTLMQILAMSEDPTGVEFYDENANFLGKIFVAGGWLKGALFQEHKGERAFIELVVSQNQERGMFRKVPYMDPAEDIAANNRIDVLLLSAIADKETEDGKLYLENQEASQESVLPKNLDSFKNMPANGSLFSIIDSYMASKVQKSQVKAQEEYQSLMVQADLLEKTFPSVYNAFSLFNIESFLLFKQSAGHLVLFTEKYWKDLFPLVDPDSLDEEGKKSHTRFIMAEIVKTHLGQKIPNFDSSFLNSEDLLEQVDIAMHEAAQDEQDVKIIKIKPGESYDEDMSLVTGFSEESLQEPTREMEMVYEWLEKKLHAEAAPLRYLFYPEKEAPPAGNEKAGTFRIVIASEHELCNRLCVNIRNYLKNDDILIYSISSIDEFTAVERSDWEDCHLTILADSLIDSNIYQVLERIPENMAICLIVDSKNKYRHCLAAPIFRERVQGIFDASDNDLANLIKIVHELASPEIQ